MCITNDSGGHEIQDRDASRLGGTIKYSKGVTSLESSHEGKGSTNSIDENKIPKTWVCLNAIT